MCMRLVILANSRKLSGRCIAGKDSDGNWIRLVKRRHDPIPVAEARHYGMLKVLEVDGIVNKPSREYNYHTENSSYTETRIIGNLQNALIENLVDTPVDIFGTGKCLNENEVQTLRESLLFVKVTDFCIYYKDCGQYGSKLRGEFTYNNMLYTDIAVTDSAIEQRLSEYSYPYQENYDEAYITVSLGEIFNGYSYKLISGVITI